MSEKERFGCTYCFEAEPERMWGAIGTFTVLGKLVQDSHLSVVQLACPKCGQRCVKVFTEMVNWTGGDDAQYISIVPITRQEADELMAQGQNLSGKSIEAFGRGRRYLQLDFPSTGKSRMGWAIGFVLGPHD